MATLQEIHDSAKRNVDKVMLRKDEIADVFVRMINLKDKNDEPIIRMRKLMSLASQMNHIVESNAACRNRCQHCCYMAVSMSEYEAQIIETDFKIKANYDVVESLDRDAIVREYINKPCPFLKPSGCSIYDSRPLACRLFWNVSDYQYLCDISAEENDVPGLDMTPFHLVTVFWFNEAKFSDIREFFSHGLRG